MITEESRRPAANGTAATQLDEQTETSVSPRLDAGYLLAWAAGYTAGYDRGYECRVDDENRDWPEAQLVFDAGETIEATERKRIRDEWDAAVRAEVARISDKAAAA